MYHIIRPHFLVDWYFLQVRIFIFIVFTVDGIVRMHQHFSTRFRLGKRSPSDLLRNFRQIG